MKVPFSRVCVFAFFIIISFSVTAEEMIDSVVFDKQEAVDLAKAFLRAQFRRSPSLEPDAVDWDNSYNSASRSPDGSEFVFVGFKVSDKDMGVSILFEICKTTPFLTPIFAGVEAGFLESFEHYGSLSKDNAGGPDSPCPEPFE